MAKVEIIFFFPGFISVELCIILDAGAVLMIPKIEIQFAWKMLKDGLRDQRVLKQQKHVPKQRSILTIDKFKSFSVLIPSKPLTSLYIN